MRTTSMTVLEAETALGARGSISITADNLPTLRKWLSARGIDSRYANKAPMGWGQRIYNDITDKQFEGYKAASLKYLATKSDKQEAPVPVPTEKTPFRTAFDDMQKGESIPVIGGDIADTTPAANDAGKALADLVGPYILRDGTILRDVMDKVDQRLANVQIIRHVIEINNHVHVVDGVAHKTLPDIIDCVMSNTPCITVGGAGGGKSTAAEMAWKACASQFGGEDVWQFFIQGAASGNHEYLGYEDAKGAYHTTAWRQCFEHGGFFCAEELDSGDPAVPLTINAGLANGHMTFPDSPFPVKRHPNFRIVGNANTYGMGADRLYVGRTQLDGATIDRFIFIEFDYDETLERAIAGNDKWVNRVQALRHAAFAEKAELIISPRASIFGAKMLARNWPQYKVEEAVIWKGANKDLRRRIEERAKA